MNNWHLIQANMLKKEYYVDGKEVKEIQIGDCIIEFGEIPNFLTLSLKIKEKKNKQ